MTNKDVERRVTAEKKIARFGKKYVAKIIPILKEFEGKKIFLKNGVRGKHFNEAVKKISKDLKLDLTNERVWVEKSYRTLQVRFSFWVSFGVRSDGLSDGDYYELYAYLGKLDSDTGLVLEKVCLERDASTRLDKASKVRYAYVRSVRDKVNILREKIKELENTIPCYAKAGR